MLPLKPHSSRLVRGTLFSPSYVSEWPDGSITKKDCLSCHVPAKADDWILREGLANPSVQIVADEQNRPKILFLTRLDCPAALFSPLEAAVLGRRVAVQK
jgi:hypothetical protein